MCSKKLSDIGVTIVTATCDGPAVNFAMYKALGAKLDANASIRRQKKEKKEYFEQGCNFFEPIKLKSFSSLFIQ